MTRNGEILPPLSEKDEPSRFFILPDLLFKKGITSLSMVFNNDKMEGDPQ